MGQIAVLKSQELMTAKDLEILTRSKFKGFDANEVLGAGGEPFHAMAVDLAGGFEGVARERGEHAADILGERVPFSHRT